MNYKEKVTGKNGQELDGMYFISTPGHGYLHLTPRRLARMSPALQTPSDFYRGDGVFEEDLEWLRVALAFADEFQPAVVESAHKNIAYFHPEIYAAWQKEQEQNENAG